MFFFFQFFVCKNIRVYCKLNLKQELNIALL